MVTHEVRFKGWDAHRIRVFCTCGWSTDLASGRTLADLTRMVTIHQHGGPKHG
jgi:hypothetical protein